MPDRVVTVNHRPLFIAQWSQRLTVALANDPRWLNRYVFIARCYAERGIAKASCPSVLSPSVTLRYRDHRH